MIRITIDLLPHGDSNKQMQLGFIEINNDGSHSLRPDYGTYDIKFNNRTADTIRFIKSGVETHDRKDGWLALIKQAISIL